MDDFDTSECSSGCCSHAPLIMIQFVPLNLATIECQCHLQRSFISIVLSSCFGYFFSSQCSLFSSIVLFLFNNLSRRQFWIFIEFPDPYTIHQSDNPNISIIKYDNKWNMTIVLHHWHRQNSTIIIINAAPTICGLSFH